jgi:2-amino-4-hydroxy-6-hydroxymethyldihydropteridine diphosphokinase
MFKTVLVAIGANLASADGRTPLETCQWAAGQLATLPGLHLRRVSRWFETRPVPVSDQPSFINGVALLSGTADHYELLQSLQAIEATSGRVRSVPNAARTLDLDLLAMDALVLATPDLILPHPRLHERAFVLAPLIDVLPGWRHPTLGVTAEQLLARVPDQHVKPL